MLPEDVGQAEQPQHPASTTSFYLDNPLTVMNRAFEFIPSYKQPGRNYHGAASRVRSGLQVHEAFAHAKNYNVTLAAGSCFTFGSYGGWITGGGHSPLSSKVGLGVDQVLSLHVMTADGHSVTARTGVIISAVIKAHPQVNLTIAKLDFFLGTATSTAPGPSPNVASSSAFWKGFDAVFAFSVPTVDAGGYLWTNGIKVAGGDNTSYTMQVQVQMPGQTLSEAAAFVQPLLDTLRALDIPITLTSLTTEIYSHQTGSVGFALGNSRFGSRLFPRAAYLNLTLFQAFFGSNYDELVRVKKEWDPWQVFWSPTTPGSEGWAVQGFSEIPTQNGQLCRV
ncbi:hypothetical protein B0H67DRAFT_645108 [Lasiosphaeris hirsuta]|uniref:FAD-binding PCMH-type domain-containing protein n=1 Tax=Lasiosphaeris hirsuta TaxID=260670 RepID=A0AA40AGD6_9PEZI|nr:hypothetical protein B0H67DRAFT_645108 [Lasiosphaeris hirsuta]